MDVKRKLREPTKAQKPEYANRILRLRKQTLRESQGTFARHFINAEGKPLEAQSVSNWERGENRPSATNFIQMGNLAAGQPEDAWFFWQAVGLAEERVAAAGGPVRPPPVTPRPFTPGARREQLHTMLDLILERAPKTMVEAVTEYLFERAGRYGFLK